MSELGSQSVVTGASRGIGRAVALALAASGRHVLGVGRDVAALNRLAQEGGPQLRTLALDVREPDHVDCIAEAAPEASELVCCAGIAVHQPVGHIDAAALRETLAVNLEAPLLLAQAFGTRMGQSGGGAIVLVSSTLARRAAPETTAYAASKAGLEAGARGLALELAGSGVRVNVVAPGVVDTDMVRAPRGDGLTPEARLELLRGLHALGRLGTPADVAQAVLYLLSASWVTGEVLGVDGGLLLG